MSKDATTPGRKLRVITLSAMIVAAMSGLSSVMPANGETKPSTVVTEPPTVIATSCSGFGADAQKLFDKAGSAVLAGTFAPGDQIHLAIDLSGASYSWEATGALGSTPRVIPSILWAILLRTSKWHIHTSTTYSPAPASTPLSTMSDGNIHGYARWELNFAVTMPGDGSLTINRANQTTPPRVVIASCTPRGGGPVAAGSEARDSYSAASRT